MPPAISRSSRISAALGIAGEERGLAFARALAEVTDALVVELFDPAVAAVSSTSRMALVALGGYGRGELAPFSDLDLLLVHDAKRKHVARQVEPVAAALWYPLWDAGLKLGHAVRSIDEQAELAADDLDSATAILTARYLAGDEMLADEVIARGRSIWSSRSAHLTELRRRVRDRQADTGEVAYVLEPDLKDGHGGLRDIQSLRWACDGGLLVRAEDEIALADCAEVLMRARVSLHLATQRSGDVLRLEDQDATATEGAWADADALMADVAVAGRTVAWLVDENLDRVPGDSERDAAPVPVAPGVVLRNGEVELADGVDAGDDPTLTWRAAVAAARAGRRISRPTLDALSDRAAPWPGAWPVGATDELMALLLEGHAAIPVLESLDQRDLFGRFFPEWSPCRSRPQRNAYHRFTVDRHLWETAANASELVGRVTRPDLLVLGALLHDIGKGYPGDHTEAGVGLVRELGPRLGLGEDDVDTLVRLVQHHLLLPDVAMRRDLSDAATIRAVADAVQTVEFLDLLHALTEADSKATGPSAWGSWKAEMIADLVARVRHVLGGGDLAEVSWTLFPDVATIAAMVDGEVNLSLDGDYVTVVSPDNPYTFASVAATLALHGLDVVSAQAHSDEHGMAASRFRVVVPDTGIRWRQLKTDLGHALRNELALEARLAERAATYRRRRRTQAQQPGPPAVRFVDTASSNATVIEVRAPNRVGLLHRVAKTIGDMGLDIRHAAIQTIGAEVVDTFYVRTTAGELVTDPFHRGEIERALLHAVT